MSGFWDNMTAPRPINRSFRSSDDATMELKNKIATLENKLRAVRQENQRLRQMLYHYKIDATAALEVKHNMSDILHSVAVFCDMEADELKTPSRLKKYRRARCMFYLKARNHGYFLKEIGRFMDRDHTTVINALNHKSQLLDDFDIQFCQL